MTLSHSLGPIIICWAVIGGLGASLLLPAMQSLIHGNFQGPAQVKAYALVGAAAALAAAVGPLLGGFITTYLSWRVGFLLEVAVIAVVISGQGLVHDVPYTGSRRVDVVGAILSVLGMGGIVLSILVWQEGGEFVLLLMVVGAVALGSLVRWLVRRKRAGRPTLVDPDLFAIPTGVDQVAVNFGQPDQRWIDKLTVAEATALAQSGELGEGSMRPKVEALVTYIERHPGGAGVITSPAMLPAALRRETGTWIQG